VSTQDERTLVIKKNAIYRGLTLLIGLVIGFGLLFGAVLANSAKDLLAGTGLGQFLGMRANEEASLSTFVIAAIVWISLVYLRYRYLAARRKALLPAL